MHDRDVRLAVERLASGQALEHEAAERVDVGGRPDGLAANLLRRGVIERADEEACLRDPLAPRPLRDPEVGQVHPPAGLEQHVGRLDVAVNEVFRMRRVERPRDLLEDRNRAVGRERPRLEQLVEVAPADVAHRDVDDPVGLARVVDRDDARVVERCDHLRLGDEARTELSVLDQVGQKGL